VTNIDGHCHLALIDSGCELSLAPSTIVGDRVLRPVSQGVFAANGSAIFVQGETEIEMNLGGFVSSATVLVSPDVSELMLGITWLTQERVVWDFSARTLLVGQKSNNPRNPQAFVVVCMSTMMLFWHLANKSMFLYAQR